MLLCCVACWCYHLPTSSLFPVSDSISLLCLLVLAIYHDLINKVAKLNVHLTQTKLLKGGSTVRAWAKGRRSSSISLGRKIINSGIIANQDVHVPCV